MPTLDELQRLLANPNENLSIEYKSWLDLSYIPGKATLAKAAIALANQGGGIIVLGMRDGAAEVGVLGSQPLPEERRRYTQDDINAAINRFADPAIHCELLFARHPGSRTEHAFVVVPGGFPVPVMSRRECQGIIAAQRSYVRKPGPRSEEPFTAEEWRALFDRCLRAGRGSMLDAIRHIVQGQAGAPPAEDALARLSAFAQAGYARWQSLVEPMSADDPARMPHGYRELTFEIRNVSAAPTLVELRRRLETAEAIRLTGWHPFISLNREPFAPKIVGGLIEAWLGPIEDKGLRRTPAHCDFWRASLDGHLYMLRGYEEDEGERRQPGTAYDVTLPIWRVAEPLLHVARLARLFGDDATIALKCRFTGLANRRLTSITGRRHISNRVSADNEVEGGLTASVAEIEDNLAELMHSLLRPLYERFDFFDLPMNLVIEELNALRAGRF
jgi:hypothetical protein